jgi:hypothetical protein
MEFHSLKQVQEMTRISEKLQTHLCSKLLETKGILRIFDIFDIFRAEGYFGHRTQYGWPKVVPRFEAVKRMLGSVDIEAPKIKVNDAKSKTKCIIQ